MKAKMTLWYVSLVLGCLVNGSHAFANGRSTPFPPGCMTVPERVEALYGVQPVLFWQGLVPLETKFSEKLGPEHKRTPYEMSLYRVPCSEPNRSLILVEFRMLQEWIDPLANQVVLPEFFGVTGFDDVPFVLSRDVPTIERTSLQVKTVIGDFTGGWWDPRGTVWRFVLDTDWGAPDYYNGQFSLQVVVNHTDVVAAILVPATSELVSAPARLPLNGRHSGIWAEPGANDQGFVLTFSNPIPPGGTTDDGPENADLMVFLSWFTFDHQGRGLWLTANERFVQGADSVDMPIVMVSEGDFLGERRANRRIVGQGSLRSVGCNHLVFEYHLGDIALGSAEIHLQRLHALEIDGYPCRDLPARSGSLANAP